MNQPRLMWMIKVFSMALILVAVLWAMRTMRTPQFHTQATSFFRMLEGY